MPPGVVRVAFEPATLSLSQNPGSSRAILVVGQAFFAGTYSVRIVATVGSGTSETIISLRILDPSPSKHFSLKANSSAWNSTETSGPNPAIHVQKGETFTVTAIGIPGDIHHYFSIFPSGTPPSQVTEYSTGYYVSTGFEWSHSGSETITFTSMITGTLEYYCNTHSNTMHGVINITD
jgi:hypothetical protein